MKNLNCEVLELDIEKAKKLVKGLVFNDDGTMVSYIDFTSEDYDTWGGYTLKEYAEAIETLLTAYEKEKGENAKLRLQDIPLIEGELKAYKDRVNELKAELEKEKEKNKELNRLKGFEMLDIFNMGKQSSRQRIEFDYVDKEKIKAGIEVAREKYNDLHKKHLRDCGIAEQRELAKIEFGESLLKEE